MNRRSLLAGAPMALAAILSLASAPALAAPKTVTLWHVFNLDTDMIHGGIEAFNKAQDEYRIETRVVPANAIVTELIKATASGSVPDLATLDNPVVASFSAQGTLADLSDLVAKSVIVKPDLYFKGPWSAAQWKGRTFGVPRDANTLALYYNADLFRAKGLDPDKPPRTWTELRAAAERLRDPAKNVYGFGFSAIGAEEGVFQFLPFLTQAGGSIDRLDGPEATAALDFLADMTKAGIVSRDVINQRQYEVANTFMAGNTAIALGGPWELPRMEREAKFDWRLTLLPVKDDKNIQASALGGYIFVSPKGARQTEGAFRFVEFMSNPRFLNEGWKTGRLAPRTDVTVENPQWPQAYGIYHEQMRSAMARGPHPQWPDISKALQTAIQEALTGTKPSAQALNEASRKIAPILAKTPL